MFGLLTKIREELRQARDYRAPYSRKWSRKPTYRASTKCNPRCHYFKRVCRNCGRRMPKRLRDR